MPVAVNLHRGKPAAQSSSLERVDDEINEYTSSRRHQFSVRVADVFAIYVKTKNFHWHMSGPHFRDYHLLLDEQAGQLFAITDPLAERARKLGGRTLHSVSQISRLQRILDNDASYVEPADMLSELREDNLSLVGYLRQTHALCDEYGDVATASLLENCIDEAENTPPALSLMTPATASNQQSSVSQNKLRVSS